MGKKLRLKNGAKLKDGKTYIFRSKATGKSLAVQANAKVSGKGGKGVWAQFVVHVAENGTVRLQSVGAPKNWLRIERGNSLNGHGSGGALCVFKVVPGKEENTVSFRSVKFGKFHVGVLPDGTAKAPEKTGTGDHGTFYVEKGPKKVIKLSNKVKLKDGRNYHFQSVASGKNLRILKDGSVDGLGGTGKWATFRASITSPNSLKLQNVADPHHWLRIQSKDSLNGLGSEGALTDFIVIEGKAKKTISLQSKKFGKIHVGILPDGKAKAPEKTGTGEHGQFKVIKSYDSDKKEVRAKLKTGRVVFLKSLASGKNLRINADGSVDGKGGEGKWAQFTVSCEKKGVIRLQNVGNPAHWLRIQPDGKLNGHGTGGDWCYFKIQKKELPDKSVCCLTSRARGKGNVGILPDGSVKSADLTGSGLHGQFIVYKKRSE